MRHVATLVVGIALTGCTLIYNPSNLPPPIDAPPIDADPTMLRLDGAGPKMLLEGQGTGGSRPAILAITGQNLTVSATVRVYATGSETPMITVHSNDPMITSKVSAASDVLAVSVTLPIDPTLPANGASAMQDIPLTIEVSQPVGAGVVTKTLTGAVTLRTLPELIAGTADSASLRPMYSQVDLSGPLTFTAAVPARPRALIRSVSSITLQAVTASAAASAPGPGGAAGGASGKPGDGNASGGGAGTLAAGGGGGGLATAGMGGSGTTGSVPGGAPNGDSLVSDYASGNLSAGGGGGVGSTGGGAGGGTVELTAAGDVHVGAITATGGVGGNGGTSPSGGGAGGIVVIRAAGTATLNGTITVTGGKAGTGGVGTAGDGSTGRTRVDAPTIILAPTATVDPPYHRGASWDPATPLTTKTSPFAMKLFGTAADKFDVVVLDGAGGASSPAFTADFGNATMITVRPTLQPGFNRVCVTKNGGGSVTVIEATNCIDLAYLP